MENNKMMKIDDFMYMFVATNYLLENREINLKTLKEYIRTTYVENFKINDKEFVFDLIDEKIDYVIKKMLNENIISYDDKIIVNDQIPLMNILKKNFNYLDKMLKFINNYMHYVFVQEKKTQSIKIKTI